jgi:hypothetical protein
MLSICGIRGKSLRIIRVMYQSMKLVLDLLVLCQIFLEAM